LNIYEGNLPSFLHLFRRHVLRGKTAFHGYHVFYTYCSKRFDRLPVQMVIYSFYIVSFFHSPPTFPPASGHDINILRVDGQNRPFG